MRSQPLSCDSLAQNGLALEHQVLNLVSSNVNSRKMSRITLDEVMRFVEAPRPDITAAIGTLEDDGFIEKQDGPFLVHKRCICDLSSNFENGFICAPGAARYDSGEATEGASPLCVGVRRTPKPTAGFQLVVNGWEESAQKSAPAENGSKSSTHYLARFYFPSQCRQARLGLTYPGDIQALRKAFWQWDLPGQTIRRMIDEFVQHPEWCRGKVPWRVFLARREALLELVRQQEVHAEREAHSDDWGYWTGEPEPAWLKAP